MLKLTLLDKFSISIPTPEISLSSPTAAAASPSVCVILPLTDSGQHGSLGRYCARRALSEFKLESEPILRNPDTREPCWPESVRGSITHTEGLAAAAVGLDKDISGVGIDMENLSRSVNFNIRRRVCVETERKYLESLSPEQANRDLRIIFSAKESIFSCLFPISRTFLYFQDATVTIDEKNSGFSFILSKACAGITSEGFQHSGKYSIVENLLLTSIYI
jgi:enterobactin synthetase component D